MFRTNAYGCMMCMCDPWAVLNEKFKYWIYSKLIIHFIIILPLKTIKKILCSCSTKCKLASNYNSKGELEEENGSYVVQAIVLMKSRKILI